MSHKTYNQILDEHLHILIAQGNYEAFVKLRKRYQKHFTALVNDMLSQYDYTGISFKELFCVCEDHFPFVIIKYNPENYSFYSFWKENTQRYLLDYLIENSYEGDAFSFKGSVSFDQKIDDSHSLSELIGEREDEYLIKKRIFEIKHIIHKCKVFFTLQERTLLDFVLEGYSLAEFEHSGLLQKSQINLTYKSAIDKLRKYMDVPDK